MDAGKFAELKKKIAEGWTLEIATRCRCWHIDQKVIDDWRQAGYELLDNREKENGFWMRRGKKHWDYVPCFDGVRLIK